MTALRISLDDKYTSEQGRFLLTGTHALVRLPLDQIRADLQVAGVRGLFAAGQINGTSGYEEAAAQGLIAGINAARFVRGEPPVVLDRASSYIGVMIDDLCRVNPREPYRMFTSRAEFRLLLRSDNADRRLTPIGQRIGLVSDERWQKLLHLESHISRASQLLQSTYHDGATLEAWLRRPEIEWSNSRQCIRR